MDGEHSRQPPQLHRPPRQRSRSSRSPSQDSADIDELIIEATTDDVERRLTRSPRQIMTHVHRGHPEMYSNMGYRPDSPIDYRSYPHHSHPRGGVPHLDSPSGGPPGVSVMSGPAMHPDASGPLERPGQVQTYQTHIFAPPVTGAPVKKSKFTSISTETSGAQGWYFAADCKILAAYTSRPYLSSNLIFC